MTDPKKSEVLFTAATAAQQLEQAGIQVIAHYSNGRRAVLIIDRPPPLVRGVLRRRQPNGRGGIERVLAAEYEGLQIEWSTHEDGVAIAPREVAHVH
ncbi:hypothetical protein [Stenotrophomonas sp. MMGLT7]|uniref:hypothetical protein n=1 Tax=Stenotrophomonas sp. MMGLT7 TaxID=2901227 RepID=UPI001E2886F8|nr:hypothetical protein [Stenotrophomonas sp. MMGLT7]MCD7099083.1 hypothetical protein [Stenotrophomonas sp. MMGLT7]